MTDRLLGAEATAAYAVVAAHMKRHPEGCCWHLVLADGNVDDGSVAFCAEEATQEAHEACMALIGPLTRMTRTQRKRAYRWEGR